MRITLPPPGQALLLQEAKRYTLSHSGAVEAFLGKRRLTLNVELGGFSLEIPHAVGHLERLLVTTDAGETLHCSVRIEPREEKLSPEAWSAMLADLDAWLSGVTVGEEVATHGQVSAMGVSAPRLVEALLPTLPALRGALRTILEAPRERARTEVEDVPIHAVRRADGATVRWLSRHPEVVSALGDGGSGRPPLVPQRLGLDTVDHPANRYLAWLALRVLAVLDDCAKELRRIDHKLAASPDDAEDRAWLSPKLAGIEAEAEELRALRTRSFLRSLPVQTATEASLAVFQDDPRYARFHRLARPFLSPRFRLQSSEDSPKAAIRPSFTLYELWTFLALQRLLERELQDGVWSHDKLNTLLSLDSTGEGALYRADLPGQGRLDLLFNATFRGYFNRCKNDRFSLTGERRPDLVLTWKPLSGEARWICLDAKYRAGRSNLADAFESLHIYRDSLRYEDFGDRCRTAYLLTPAQDNDCADWFSADFIETYGLGAFRLTPGGAMGAELLARILRDLGVSQRSETFA